MSMEFKLDSMESGESRLLFRDGGVELPGSFGAFRDTKSSGEGKIYEELEPKRELDSSSEDTGRLAEDALARATRGD